MSVAPEPLHYRTVAVAGLVASTGPQPIRERYIDARRTARRRRAANKPASRKFIAVMQGLQHEGFGEVDRLRGALAAFPAGQVAAVGDLLSELRSLIDRGHHTTATPSQVNDLWVRAESAVAALAATRPGGPLADGPQADSRTVRHGNRSSAVVSSPTTFRFIEFFWDAGRDGGGPRWSSIR